MKAGIALGSNLGDRLRNLQQARARICALDGVATPILRSAIYETAPVDCEPGAENFYNAVIEIGFEKSSHALLQALQGIEESLGRSADHKRNTSRTIDLDLLYFGEEKRAENAAEKGGYDGAAFGTNAATTRKGLQLPHPRIAEREFVLRPLADIAPELLLPGETASVRELLARIPASARVKCVTKQW